MRSTSFMFHCVVISSRAPFVERRVVGDRAGGDHHASGVDRRMAGHPFEALADVDDFLDLGVLGDHVLEDGFSVSALSSVMSSAGGICLAIRSTSAYGMSSARPTSRTTAFAFIVPKVMICATFSRPYFRVT